MAGNNAKNIANLAHERCTGCSVCANQCQSISMATDEDGFLYPEIDDSCTECGQCANICPMLNKTQPSTNALDVYAAWSLDDDIRFTSTSGGVFSELALCVLRSGGYVAGARYNDALFVEHTLIDREIDLPLLRQSKYI
jgi:coenzyme F420-reducing hydrogenase beta subunit